MATTPRIGEIVDNYRFLGGDPSSKDSWESFSSPKQGDILDGFVFNGGDPSSKDSWKTFKEETLSDKAKALAKDYLAKPVRDYLSIASNVNNSSVTSGLDGTKGNNQGFDVNSGEQALSKPKQAKQETLKEGSRVVDGISGVAEVGARKGYAGLGRIEAGAISLAGDMLDSDTLRNVSKNQLDYADKVENSAVLRGTKSKTFEPSSGMQELPELSTEAIGSVITSAPAVAAGAGAIPAIFATSALSDYGTSGDQLNVAGKVAHAVGSGAAEALGEKLGGTDKFADALMSALGGKSSLINLGTKLLLSGAKEIPSEEVTTTAQFLLDKNKAFGLNQDATLEDYKNQVIHTAKVAALQGAGMAGAGGVIKAALGNKEKPVEGMANLASNSVDTKIQANNEAIQAKAKSDAALPKIQEATSLDEAIAYAQEAVNMPINTGLLNPLPNDALANSAPEAIDAADILGGENVSNTDDGITSMVDSAIASAGDNVQASVGDLSNQPESSGMGDVTGASTRSSGGGLLAGAAAAGNDAVNRPFATADDAFLKQMRGMTADAKVLSQIDAEIELRGLGPVKQPANVNKSANNPQAQVAGEKIDNEWTAFSPESGTLNIPRSEMPQVKAEHRGAMVNFLNARGIDHSQETVPADSLKPTQQEFSEAKVKKASEYVGGDRSILVSADNHVLDGHHQWLAKLQNGDEVDVIRLNAPIDQLLNDVKEFPSSTIEGGATSITPEKQAAIKPAKPKAAKPSKPKTLLARLRDIGGIKLSDKLDITGEQKGFAPAGYNQVFKEASNRSLKGLIESGDLDEYLPYSMRLESNGANDEAFDSTEAYDYIADKIRNGGSVLPYEVEEEAKANKYYQESETTASADVDELAELFNEDEINEQLRIASRQEREAATEAKQFITEFKDGDTRSGTREETGNEGRGVENESQQEVTKGADLLGDSTANQQALADAERAKDAKRNSGNDNQDTFTLTGSNSEADQAAAAGAQDLFEAPVKTQSRKETSTGAESASNATAESRSDQANSQFADNKIFTADKVAAARARLKSKLGNMNSGIDPELLIDGMTIAGAYIESGVRSFSAYSKAMVADFGDSIKPYLLSFYEAARAYPSIDKSGMTDAEAAAAEHQALLTTAVKEIAKEVIGQGVVESPKAKAKPNGQLKLTQDWGVDSIDGWTDNKDGTGTNEREDGVTNGVKDQFLNEAKKYLTQVSKLLEAEGYEAHKDQRGRLQKAVSVSESGPATSGDGHLIMRKGNAGVYVSIGVTSVSGMGLTKHPQGVSVMIRTTGNAETDRYATKGQNIWLSTDLSSTELANKLMQTAERYVKNTEQAEEGTQNARANQAEPVLTGRAKNDLLTKQPRGSDSEPLDAGMAGSGEETTGDRGVSGSATETSGNRAPSTSGSNRNESPSGSREASNAGNTASSTDVDNFSITSDTATGEGSANQKYRNNVEAIKLIKTLDAEKRIATPEERETLAKYAGFGALSGVFDKNNTKFSKEYAELKELLTPDEYDAARASILNAYYTSPVIVKNMYDAVSHLGFKNGRVLEPSMGSGNFFGMMPASMRSKSNLNGVELDVITSRLAKYLYPKANIAVATGFQNYDAPEGYFDLVISNPPFGSEKISDNAKRGYSGFSIHNYFIAKSIDKLREGGVMAVVVSHSFMDAQNSQAREWISKRANLLGAVRLPKEAFKDIAGTEVITDILYFQKTATPEANPAWLNAKDNGDYSFNEYFYATPRNVLGRIVDTTSQFGKTYTIESVPTNGTMQQLLKEFNERLPQGVYVEPTSRIEVLDSADSTVPDGVKVGTFYKDDKGNVRQRMPDLLGAKRSQAWESPNAKATERMLGMMDLRDLLRTQMRLERDAMASTKEIEANRTKLNKAYDAFLKQYGFLNSTTNRRLFMDDTESALVQALEMDYDAGVTKARALSTGMEAKEASAQKADIFNRRVLFPPSDSIVVNNAQDALLQSLDAKGRVDVDYMAEVYNKPINEIVAELGDVVMNDPTKGYVTADEYLSGDVKTKLAEAKKAALTDGAFQRNVEALEKVIPKDKLPSEIFASAGANWIPADVYADFAAEITGVPKDGIEFNYVSAAATWLSDRTKGGDAGKMTSDYGTGEVDAFKIFSLLINGRSVEVKKSVSNGEGGTKSVVDVEKTDAANAKYQKIKELWSSWVFSDPERADRLASIYNDKHNRIVARKFDGSHMNFYGMSPSIKLIASQKNVVWRAIQDRNVLFDHVVGAGKTFAMAATAMEMKRLGISRKPMFVVPNHLTLQWRSEFTRLYPASNILAATPEDFAKDKREKMFSKMVTGGYDAIIIGHSSLTKVGLPSEIEERMYNEQVKEIADAIEQAKTARGDRGVTRAMEQIKQNIENKIKKLKEKAGAKDNVVTWDELGIDGLFIDEMHEFKNLFFTTQMQRTAGLGNPAGSGKALDLFMKVRHMQQTIGENAPLITATGTPVSNSLAEMFTMQRYMKYDHMKRSDLHLFDAWAKQYGEIENVYEVAPSGVGYRQSTRFSKFKNLPSLMANYTSFADVITLQDLKDQSASQGKVFPVPKIASGRPINVIAQRSELQRDYFGIPKLDEDEAGNIKFELDIEKAGIEAIDDGKYRLSFENGFKDFDTRDAAALELVTKSLMPKTYLDPESLLGKFANLKELTQKTKGKINALSLTGLANKAGLDFRIINPSAPDFAGSKINLAVGNMVSLWKDTAKDKGTQIVFCDMSVPASARASAASKERYALVRDRNSQLIHKKATLHTAEGFEGFPFYIVESGSKDSKSFAVYEPLSGLLLREGMKDKQSAKEYMANLVSTDNGRDSIFAIRDRNETITKDDIDEYFAEQEKIEIADDGGNLITPEDLESIAGSSQFSVYDDIKAKLIGKGVPEVEIAFIHDYNTPKQKEELFKRVNRGEVRFLFGSTPKLGAGTNVQKRLVGLHHIDAPWRPSDLEQREGRIIRQGNELYARDPDNFEVSIWRYATEQTYDTRRWQLLEHKASGIEQLRKYSGESEIEDVAGEASNSADMKAAASGNPLVLEETKLRTEVKRLQNLEKAHADSKFSMLRKIRQNEGSINEYYPRNIAKYEDMISLANQNPIPSDKDKVALTIVDGQRLTDREKTENAIGSMATRVRQAFNMGDVKVINYRGIEFTVERGISVGMLKLMSPSGHMHTYLEKDNFSPSGLITRFNNYIDSLESRIEQAKAQIAVAEKENSELQPRLNDPFEQADLLKKMQARHDSVKRKLMKSTQLEAVPENQLNKFNKLLEQRRNKLIEAGYEDVLKKAEAEDDDVPMFSRNDPFFSLGTGTRLQLKKSKYQFGAKVLNKALVKYFGDNWSDSFESVDVPDTLLAYKQEIKTAFGKELRFVSPTSDEFDIFSGVQLPKSPDAIYVNARAEENLTTIAGHEIYHTLERSRPDLHSWFKSQAKQHLVNFGTYHKNLNDKLQKGEKPYKSDVAMSELLADFTGDALSDPVFLQQLANADGSKFKGLLNTTIRFLNEAITKLKNLKSSQYISDVEALRDKLKQALLAFSSGKQISDFVPKLDAESDEKNKGILYSRNVPNPAQSRLTPQWETLEESSLTDNVIRKLQDKNIDLKRVTQSIKAAGVDLADRWNAYLQEELYHGRSAKRVQDFLDNELNPLIENMRELKVSMADLEQYLWNRHAEERNIQVAKVNPDMPDGGSGINTQAAQDYLAALTPEQKANYEALAARVYAINAGSRQTLVDYGLESAGTIAAWNNAYKNYVPLKRDEMDLGFGMGTGQGFSVKGAATKRAMGSSKEVVDIIANIAQQREQYIIRGEKNRVATALIGLAKTNPNEDFWQVDSPPRIRAINKQTGLVEEYTDPNYKNHPNVIVARIVNKRGEVEERSVVFEKSNERAMRMAASMKNLDIDQMEHWLRNWVAPVTRYIASVNTQYNPIFGILNITRDVQGALLNLTTTPIAGKQKEVLINTGKAMAGIYKDMRSVRDGKGTVDTQWSTLWEEFQREGGKTGYRDMHANAAERSKALEKSLDPTWWKNTKLGIMPVGKMANLVTANGFLVENDIPYLRRATIKSIFNWLSDYNETLENSVRLATYKVAIDSGLSKQQSASIAKNISVNFNRKGNMGQNLGALYAFFNASVQGTARLAETLTGKRGKQVIGGLLLLGSMQAVAMMLAGFGDDEPPEFVRDRNIIIPLGNKRYGTIPIALGYNAISNVGRILTEWALSGFDKTNERLVHILSMAMEAYNPIGGNGSIMSIVTPTALDPVNDLTQNEDWTGRQISREDISPNAQTAGFTRTKDKTWSGYIEVARFINKLTGGTEYTAGTISPTGDAIDYLVGQAFGGVGRELSKTATTAEALVTGEDLPPYKVPLLGRFYGDAKGQAAQSSEFYDNLRMLGKHETEIKGRRADGIDTHEYRKENPEATLIAHAKQSDKIVRNLRKLKESKVEAGAPASEVKAVDERITKQMQKLNELVRKKKETADQ